jgi:hypothetical protein
MSCSDLQNAIARSCRVLWPAKGCPPGSNANLDQAQAFLVWPWQSGKEEVDLDQRRRAVPGSTPSALPGVLASGLLPLSACLALAFAQAGRPDCGQALAG